MPSLLSSSLSLSSITKTNRIIITSNNNKIKNYMKSNKNSMLRSEHKHKHKHKHNNNLLRFIYYNFTTLTIPSSQPPLLSSLSSSLSKLSKTSRSSVSNHKYKTKIKNNNNESINQILISSLSTSASPSSPQSSSSCNDNKSTNILNELQTLLHKIDNRMYLSYNLRRNRNKNQENETKQQQQPKSILELTNKFCLLYHSNNFLSKDKILLIHYMISNFGYSSNSNNSNALSGMILQLSQQQQSARDNNNNIQMMHRIRELSTPKYESLLKSIVTNSQGISFLIDLRGELLSYYKQRRNNSTTTNHTTIENKEQFQQRNQELKYLNKDIQSLLSIWFNTSMLQLKQITYESTSASIIEKIAFKEAVHPLKSLNDLRYRLSGKNGDRCCYAFFHPSLPDTIGPIVFVHIALLDYIPCCMKDVLLIDDDDKLNKEHDIVSSSSISHDNNNISAAIFYSITQTQHGLSGINLGNLLIKRVIQTMISTTNNNDNYETSNTTSDLKIFATLSPIGPQFRTFIKNKFLYDKNIKYNEKNNDDDTNNKYYDKIISKKDRQILYDFIIEDDCNNIDISLKNKIKQQSTISLKDIWILLDTSTSWYNKSKANNPNININIVHIIKPMLLKLTIQYLLYEKHHGKPLDSVQKFHLSNGAQLYQINFLADDSRKGMHTSFFGIMVNYQYILNDIERNCIDFETDGIVRYSSKIDELISTLN